jgi:four helix bundle protein
VAPAFFVNVPRVPDFEAQLTHCDLVDPAPPPPEPPSRSQDPTAATLAAVAVFGTLEDEPVLDANKLHVYGIALELHTLCSTLVALLNRIVRDQLERASLSVVLNIAEAGGRRSCRDKARYYAIARGSATEVAALFDVLEKRRLAPPSAIRSGRRLAVRVVQMLTRMDQRLVP